MTYKTATNKQGTQNDIKGIHKRMATDTSKDMQSDFPITTQGIKKMLLCIQIGTGKMGKMTTNRKQTKTQKLMRTQNTTDTQNDFTDKTAKRCKRP